MLFDRGLVQSHRQRHRCNFISHAVTASKGDTKTLRTNQAGKALDLAVASMRQGHVLQWKRKDYLTKVNGQFVRTGGVTVHVAQGELEVVLVGRRPVELSVSL